MLSESFQIYPITNNLFIYFLPWWPYTPIQMSSQNPIPGIPITLSRCCSLIVELEGLNLVNTEGVGQLLPVNNYCVYRVTFADTLSWWSTPLLLHHRSNHFLHISLTCPKTTHSLFVVVNLFINSINRKNINRVFVTFMT